MTALQTRALVLLAGNGTALVFIGSWLNQHPNALGPAEPPEVNAIPLLIGVALAGLVSGWFMLRDAEHKTTSEWETYSAACFGALMAFLLLWAIGNGWFTAVEP